MKVEVLREKLSKLENDEEIFIKAAITNKYGHQDILFISFDDLKKEDGKNYLTLNEIVGVEDEI